MMVSPKNQPIYGFPLAFGTFIFFLSLSLAPWCISIKLHVILLQKTIQMQTIILHNMYCTEKIEANINTTTVILAVDIII